MFLARVLIVGSLAVLGVILVCLRADFDGRGIHGVTKVGRLSTKSDSSATAKEKQRLLRYNKGESENLDQDYLDDAVSRMLHYWFPNINIERKEGFQRKTI